MKIFRVIALLCLSLGCVPVRAELQDGSMEVHWNPGAEDCKAAAPAPLQVHRYNDRTFIIRENLCVTEEGPFMYLLVGSARALLIDTGDVADPAVAPVARTVLGLLPTVGASHLPLLVVHTHGHLDHRRGDAQFQGLPGVQVVATDLQHVTAFFGFKDWPRGTAVVDLGDRQVDVLPTPGHSAAEVSYYDRSAGLLFTGDFLLPGRLLIADKAADLASALRVADFIRFHPVAYVLGGHIELDADGDGYGLGAHYHPNEHVLQMTRADVLELPALVNQFNGFYTRVGPILMLNQNRVLAASAIGLLIALVGAVWGSRRYIRYRRHRWEVKRPYG